MLRASIAFLVVFNILVCQVNSELTWSWVCNEKSQCVRVGPITDSKSVFKSIEVCRLVCGNAGSVWPIPTKAYVKSNELIGIDASKIKFEITAPAQDATNFLLRNADLFRANVRAECGGKCVQNENTMKISIEVKSGDLTLNWSTDESYEIVTANSEDGGKTLVWTIKAQTVFGARHALETVSQLVAAYNSDDGRKLVTVTKVHIKDAPVYPHRSLLLDTARNYLSVEAIKRQLDGMAASKMNVMHWHATDSQSFPYVSRRVPNLSIYGAYSAEKVYTPNDVADLMGYAKTRGIRIIMEIDAPAHAGNGWQWGPEADLGNLAVCVNQPPYRSYCIQPPCGQLNPANHHVYDVLKNLYSDIVDQFPKDEIFHMGGDEVFVPCWNSSSEIVNYMAVQGKGRSENDFMDLWGEFQANALSKYDEVVGHNKTPILLWSSDLTNPDMIEKYLSKDRYIIETWVPSTDDLPKALLDKGYKLIISTKNAWYLDHGFWGVTKYYTWRTAYTNKIIRHKNVLGGEVCMWGELVDESAIDGRIWPRAAAAAERLWSDPKFGTAEAEPRMYRHRQRLVTRGIDAESLAPQWCYQNEGQCL